MKYIFPLLALGFVFLWGQGAFCQDAIDPSSDALNGKWDCGYGVGLEFNLPGKTMSMLMKGEEPLAMDLNYARKSGDTYQLAMSEDGSEPIGELRMLNNDKIVLVDEGRKLECERVK